MDQARMGKQMINFQKLAFDSMIGSMLFYWDSTESLSKMILDQTPWMPDEGKRAFAELVKGNKRAIEQVKQAVDDGFNKMDRCVMSTTDQEWQHRQEQSES